MDWSFNRNLLFRDPTFSTAISILRPKGWTEHVNINPGEDNVRVVLRHIERPFIIVAVEGSNEIICRVAAYVKAHGKAKNFKAEPEYYRGPSVANIEDLPLQSRLPVKDNNPMEDESLDSMYTRPRLKEKMTNVCREVPFPIVSDSTPNKSIVMTRYTDLDKLIDDTLEKYFPSTSSDEVFEKSELDKPLPWYYRIPYRISSGIQSLFRK